MLDKQKRKASLLLVLFLPFIVQLILYITFISIFSYRTGQHAVYELYNILSHEIADNFKNQMISIFKEPKYINELNAYSLKSGHPSVYNQKELESLFINQIKTFSSVSSIYFGNVNGGLVDAGRDHSDNSIYVINTDNFEAGMFKKHSINDDGTYKELLTSIPDFDARTRAWYQDAVNKNRNVWSDIYILFTGNDMAISASKPVYDESNDLLGVVSNDISLKKLNSILLNFKKSIPGTYFLTDTDGLLIASSTDESTIIRDQDQLRRKHIRNTIDPVLKGIGDSFIIEENAAQADSDLVRSSDFMLRGEKYLYHIILLSDNDGLEWNFGIVLREAELTKDLNSIKRNLFVILILAIIISSMTSLFIFQLIGKPIQRLNRAVKAFTDNKKTDTLTPEWIKEINDVSAAFNEMSSRLNKTLNLLSDKIIAQKRAETEKLELERQYFHSQKIESIGLLAGGIAHDLNNLLTPIIGYSEFLYEDLKKDKKVQDMTANILSASFKARDLISKLLAYSRKQRLEYKSASLNEIVYNIEEIFRRTMRENINLEIVPSPDLPPVYADTGQIEQVLTNLLVNSQDAMPKGGTIRIETNHIEIHENTSISGVYIEPDTYCVLIFHDTGEGIDISDKPNIFNPFFTTKGELGTGLGLSTSYGIIKQHKGYIFVESKKNVGTTFTIYLPSSDQDYVEKKREIEQPSYLQGTETILVCEDNEMVLDLIETILTNNGYKILSSSDPEQALEIAGKYKDDIDLLLTDIILPKMNGKELYQKILKVISGINVLYISGYADNIIDNEGIMDDNSSVLLKPFTTSSLVTKVQQLFESKNSSSK